MADDKTGFKEELSSDWENVRKMRERVAELLESQPGFSADDIVERAHFASASFVRTSWRPWIAALVNTT